MNWLRALWNIFRTVGLLRDPLAYRALAEILSRQRQVENLKQSHPQLKLSTGVRLIGFASERLIAGEQSAVCEGSILSFGDESEGFGKIEIGENTWIGERNNIRANGSGDIQIGRDCLISQFCNLISTNHGVARDGIIREQKPDSARNGIIVGDDVWLGAGSVITAGVSIGKGAVVGANAVVTRDIPAYEIWAGVPAKKICERQ